MLMEKGETTEFRLNLRGTIETSRIEELIERLGGVITDLQVELKFAGGKNKTEVSDASQLDPEESREPIYAGKSDFFEFAEKSKISMYDRRFASQSWTILSRPYFLQRKYSEQSRPKLYDFTKTDRNYLLMRLPEGLFNEVAADDPRLDERTGYYDFEVNAYILHDYANDLTNYKRSHFNAGEAIVRFWKEFSIHTIEHIDKSKL